MGRSIGTTLVLQRTVSDDDRRIIRGFLAGEPDCIATLDAWIEVVLRLEFRPLVPDWEDLRQEIRVRVLRNLKAGRFQGASELRTYVHRIAKNACIDHCR